MSGRRESLFLRPFSGPLTQQEVWALLRAWVTVEGVSSLAWEPHWDKAGAPWGNSDSLWDLSCMTLNAQRLLLTALFKKVYKASNNYVFLGLKISFMPSRQQPFHSASQICYSSTLLDFSSSHLSLSDVLLMYSLAISVNY